MEDSRGECVSSSSINNDFEFLQAQSIELRKGLEDLMEHIQSSRHEESSESLEERYLLLVSSFPQECLSMAVSLTDADVMNYENNYATTTTSEATLRLPIHLAFDKSAPLSIVKSLLEADARKNGDHPSIHKADKWGDLPIHIACSRASTALSDSDRQLYNLQVHQQSLVQALTDRTNYDNEIIESIQLLLQADTHKTSLSVKDVNESLPLHTAARYNAPSKVISLLLETGGRVDEGAFAALYTEGLHGQFPLTVACRSGSPRPDVLKLLLDCDDEAAATANRKSADPRPSTVFAKETTGRLPIHVFMLRNQCEECTRILLEAMFGTSRRHRASRNSILSIGLDAWKALWLTTVIPAMDGKTLYERDFTTRDKLDVICEEARAWCEVCWSLELATWKMSCLKGISNVENQDDETKLLQDAQWKKHRRIVSGTEIIVPNILSFLEDEPVERILERFRTYGYLYQKEKSTNHMAM